MKSLSVSSYFVGKIIKIAFDKGVNINDLLTKHQIPPILTDNESVRISASQFAKLQQSITIQLQDEMLGYYERPLPPGTFAVACRSLIHSRSLSIALKRYCQFYRLVDRGMIPDLSQDSDYARIGITPVTPSYDYDIYAYEATLYYIHRLMSWLCQYHIPLQQVNLSYPMPEHAREYRPLFLGAPTVFNQPKSELIFNNAYLKSPVVQNQQTLTPFLRKAVYEMLVQDYDSNLWSSKVQKIISRDLTSIPNLDNLSDELSIHPQTLRRRLDSEGTNFQDIKNHVRRDLAIYKLSRTKLSIEEIALEAGFSETSTFIRAFKAWTGVTPLSYRKA